MTPQYLYQYQRLSENTYLNLMNSQIYFPSPSRFNDPFDCSCIEASIKASLMNNDTIIKLYNEIKKKNKTFQSVNSINDIHEEDKMIIRKDVLKIFKEYENKLRKFRGCACLSEINDNILMWSHYADKHRGICLKFDTSSFPFTKVIKVTYSNKIPDINLIFLIFNQNDDNKIMHFLIANKAEQWSYEKEWRMLAKPQNVLININNALKAIYFGCEVSNQDIRNIIKLVRVNQNQNIEFYKAYKNIYEYSLYFQKLT